MQCSAEATTTLLLLAAGAASDYTPLGASDYYAPFARVDAWWLLFLLFMPDN
jgi:hypothetical protein